MDILFQLTHAKKSVVSIATVPPLVLKYALKTAQTLLKRDRMVELVKLGDWFTSNKLSLNIKKTEYIFFHKNSIKDSIPLKLPDLHIFNKTKNFFNKILRSYAG